MRFTFRINKRDVLAVALLCLIGLAAVLQVSASSVARVSGWGAGVLPVFIGSVLMLAGVLVLFNSRLSPDNDEDVDIGVSKWRGSCGPVSGVFLFLLLGKYVGVAAGVFALVFVSVLGDRHHTWRSASVLAVCATLAAAVIVAFFNLPVVLIGWN